MSCSWKLRLNYDFIHRFCFDFYQYHHITMCSILFPALLFPYLISPLHLFDSLHPNITAHKVSSVFPSHFTPLHSPKSRILSSTQRKKIILFLSIRYFCFINYCIRITLLLNMQFYSLVEQIMVLCFLQSLRYLLIKLNYLK